MNRQIMIIWSSTAHNFIHWDGCHKHAQWILTDSGLRSHITTHHNLFAIYFNSTTTNHAINIKLFLNLVSHFQDVVCDFKELALTFFFFFDTPHESVPLTYFSFAHAYLYPNSTNLSEVRREEGEEKENLGLPVFCQGNGRNMSL